MSFPLPGGFGCNYTHFAPPTDLSKQMGVLATYSDNRTLAQEQIGQMRANGQTCMRIPSWVWAAEESFIADGWVIAMNPDSTLDDVRAKNLALLLADIKAAGFTWVEFGYGAMGVTLSPVNGTAPWTGELGDRWKRGADFIAWIRQNFLVPSGIPFRIDLAGESIPTLDTETTLMEYVQTLWTWYTTAYSLGKRCQDATISFVPDPEAIKNLPTVFRGDDPNGLVNWPDLETHVYGAEDVPGWGSAYTVLCAVLDSLDAFLAPPETLVDVGETYSFRDLSTVAGLLRSANDRPKRKVNRLLSWPMTRAGELAGQAFDAAPGVEGITISGDPV